MDPRQACEQRAPQIAQLHACDPLLDAGMNPPSKADHGIGFPIKVHLFRMKKRPPRRGSRRGYPPL